MKAILVAIQDPLSEQQLEELKQEYSNITLLKDWQPGLFARMANCPSEADKLKQLASEFIETFIGEGFEHILRPIGSPAFNAVLDRMLEKYYPMVVTSVFAHSERVSVDEPQADGSVVKKSLFKHVKFIKI